MDLLDAVNYILPKLGEHPVTSTEIRHPTLGVLLPSIENTSDTLQLRGWWFNQFEDYTAHPNGDDEIVLPEDVLSFVPKEGAAALRGNKLFNPETLDYTWDSPVTGRVTLRVPFEELPETAAIAVRDSALVASYTEDLGASSDLQIWINLAAASEGALLAEHLRHKRYTTRKSRRFRRLRNAMRGS